MPACDFAGGTCHHVESDPLLGWFRATVFKLHLLALLVLSRESGNMISIETLYIVCAPILSTKSK